MAEHKIQGGDMLLFIDPTGGTNYDTVVCLTSVSSNDSVSVVDASSACGPDKSPGTIEVSISFEGQHLQDPVSGTISGTNLLQLLRAEQTIGWKLSPSSPVAGDEIQEGTGFISELSSTYSYDTIGVFTMSISPYGLPTITIVPSGPTLSIGQSYQGGTIAYIDGTGLHGFVVWNSGAEYIFDQWSTAYGLTGASGIAIGDATSNTENIVLNTTSIVASNIYFISINGYTDWGWPTKNEIREIINNAGAFPTPLNPGIFIYQSSSEIDANNFWGVAINGSDYPSDKLTLYSTMIIRYF